MHGNHHSLLAESIASVSFAVLSWAGNLPALQQIDTAFEPVLHITQWAAAIIAILVGLKALSNREKKK